METPYVLTDDEAAGPSSMRHLELTYGSLCYCFTIPGHLYSCGSKSVQRFSVVLANQTTEELQRTEPDSVISLMIQYLVFLATEIQKDNQGQEFRNYLQVILLEFDQEFLRDDIHSFAATLPEEHERFSLIRSYCLLKVATNYAFSLYESQLFKAAGNEKATIFTIFGGQGNNEHYFEEVREVYQLYYPFIGDFIDSWSKLLIKLSQDSRTGELYTTALDVTGWLQNPETTPDDSYLISCAVSFPVIGIIQLANYAVMCKLLGATPGEVLKYISGTTGHSQGVVVAAALASVDSWQSFAIAAENALTILFWIGCRSQQSCPQIVLDPNSIKQSIDNGEGTPTPMLSITDLPRSQLLQHVDEVNSYLPANKQIDIALKNDDRNTVLAGPASSLCGLNNKIREHKCPASLDQTRVPFSKRKIQFKNRFLPITAPFHSRHLVSVSDIIRKDLESITLHSSSLRIPVFGTESGEDLRKLDTTNLIPLLVSMVIDAPVDWRRATDFPGVTHILDFGPGGTSGIGTFTHRAKQGMGVRVILATVLSSSNLDIGAKYDIYSTKHSLKYGTNWLKLYGPKLVKAIGGTTFIETKMSQLLGQPPIMVAGMTPTTTRWEFVVATMNSGYHIELAGGGFSNSKVMTEAIHNIQRRIPPGRGLTINLIYASPRSIQWQLSLIRQLRQDGTPIHGLTIGAGVPSLDVANEYIKELGLSHIAFKPGSTEAINAVLKIAKANPDFPIMLQWTGGRGGGHHSFEDFHAPILNMYGTIRACNNIILVAGSGFGEGSDIYPYISGSWSQKFGYAPMPFDGCLFGSRVMVAKEAYTSGAVKRTIAETKGVDNDQWEKTYDTVTGGIITVKSEMGEPIHMIATRGVLLWVEMDRNIFSLDKGKRIAALEKYRASIIRRLNDDFQKVWFGCSNGKAVDLEDMTYAEVLYRLVELLYIKRTAKWIDVSYQRIILDFIRRLEERFMHSDTALSIFQDSSELLDPYTAIENVLNTYPEAQNQLMNIADMNYFLHVCQRPGQKPVTFVPALDENFETWFKKDSLWQSENLEAVVGQDSDRCCILQGPVAVKHTKIVDEPIKQILDGINKTLITLLTGNLSQTDFQKGDQTVATLGDAGIGSTVATELDGITGVLGKDEIEYRLSSSNPPNPETWFAFLAGRCNTWRHALFMTENIVQDRKLLSNPIRRIFKPAGNVHVRIAYPDIPSRTIITLFETTATDCLVSRVDIQLGNENMVYVNMFAYKTANGTPAILSLKYNFLPQTRCSPLHEVMEGRQSRIKSFYYQLWFGNTDFKSEDLLATHSRSRSFVISRKMIKEFVNAVGISGEDFLEHPGKLMSAPMDLAMAISWKGLIEPLFSVDADLSLLVHLSNEFKVLPGQESLREGDSVESTASVTAILNQDSGKLVEVTATITRECIPVIEVISKFLYRGTYSDYEDNFQRTETSTILTICSGTDLAVLRSKAWLRFQDSGDGYGTDLVGRTLIFKTQSLVQLSGKAVYRNIETTGKVFLKMPIHGDVQIGIVNYQSSVAQGNPVTDYLRRHGSPLTQHVSLKNPISIKTEAPILLKIASANWKYAEASGDYNPIHTSLIFSRLANLPGTITHGMYSSAAVRNLVERWVYKNEVGCMRRFYASFVGMVLPKAELEVCITHTGMIDGCKIVSIEASNADTKEKVLIGEAEIELPTTVYLFTGQGSQEKNMGMDLYAQSPAAKAIWDKADDFFFDNYGISLLEIVRKNPKELTVFFGGPRGQAIRQNYMNMVHEVFEPDGSPKTEKIFKEINEYSLSYTHRAPNGLLSATQFTQPALTIMEMASLADMRSKGLVSPNCMFAGHSLGEYSALAALANIMPLEKWLSIVFYRGLTMQAAVKRDAAGRSDYSMVAVDPSRISKSFNETSLRYMVERIADETNLLLEIVNFNIESMQYVCAGSLQALDCLTNLANLVKATEFDMTVELSSSNGQSRFSQLLQESLHKTKKGSQPLVLRRGVATVPLNSIDVPFHSSFLYPNLASFRDVLLQNISLASIDPKTLIGRYVPNVTALPFDITREYFQKVHYITRSPVIEKVLAGWDPDYNSSPSTPGTASTEWEVVA
ncbi:hypothetical protein B7463_g7700, partial [Scytalidium lignicola]